MLDKYTTSILNYQPLELRGGTLVRAGELSKSTIAFPATLIQTQQTKLKFSREQELKLPLVRTLEEF